jgi:cysteinyl-tRNA synthetase
MVRIEGRKMSKSEGNGIDLFDMLNDYPADAVRLFLLSKRYRRPMDFSFRAIHAAVAQLERLQRLFARIPTASDGIKSPPVARTALWAQFCRALEDDFNFPMALAAVFSGVKACNRALDGVSSGRQNEPAGPPEALQNDLSDICREVLGLTLAPAAVT